MAFTGKRRETTAMFHLNASQISRTIDRSPNTGIYVLLMGNEKKKKVQ